MNLLDKTLHNWSALPAPADRNHGLYSDPNNPNNLGFHCFNCSSRRSSAGSRFAVIAFSRYSGKIVHALTNGAA